MFAGLDVVALSGRLFLMTTPEAGEKIVIVFWISPAVSSWAICASVRSQ
jgi:hypothetical protein